ncbi:MAG: efflux RND transporter permease subunit [Bryobacterales bacterium]|nr:efflux RND transporter permease subunit [Bryobacterales bacterium]MBV9401420.1 efflux RND transporter permease subunit [Bryobacterales bacterium]
MLNRLIDLTLAYRWLFLFALAALLGVGGYALYTIPVEAFPDLTNNQVVVVTDAPALPPTEVEQLVTYPIERAMLGLPNKEEVRSLSKLGLSMVTVVFDDSVAMYFARQLVAERLQQISSTLPRGIQPVLGLPATAFGELYQYTLSGPMNAMELKDLHEWVIKPQLRTLPGVSEINAWGGQTKQFQIVADPALLDRYGLTLHDVAQRVEENNTNFGGGYIEHASEQYTLVGAGRASTVADLGNIVLHSKGGTPLLLREVSEVRIGSAPPEGATLRNGETVSGMVIMLKGQNGKQLIERVKERIASLHLPAGVKLVPFYDQSLVIDGTIHTVEKNLFEGFVLVTIVLLLFLGNLRAALITAAIIPFSMLIGFLGMRLFGISANLMSLGAIDFGMIVDGAVVMMENSVRRLREQHGRESPLESVRHAAHEVARPMTFAVIIIVAVYLPILFLQGLEGRMFRPMAITVCAALAGSLLLALTMVPLLASFSFRTGAAAKREGRIMSRTARGYSWLLIGAMRFRVLTVAAAAVMLAIALGSLYFMGTEFMPKLDEGSILVETRKLPGVSLTESIEISKRIERRLRQIPEIADVVIKIGRPDFATEAMGINEGDTYLLLRPMETWTRFHTKEALIQAVAKELDKIPGVAYSFTQPMAMRIDETISGVKADLAVKVFGDDFRELDRIGQEVLRVVSGARGAAEPQMEITSGVAELSVNVDRAALARYGLNVTDVEEAVSSGGSGDVISEVLDGQRRYTVALRLPGRYRTDPDAMRNILLRAPGGEQVVLEQVARVGVRRGPELINREQGQRRIVVMSNVRGRDLGSFVAEVRARIDRDIALPTGYFVEYGGQFENQQRATRRLTLIVPIAIALIFILLYLTFGSVKLALLVVGNVPFALVGGVAALWIRGMNLNLSASVGFIALFGVAMLNGVVLIGSINQMRYSGMAMRDAVLNGARRRLRAVLMTAFVASFGFIPMAISTSTGAEVQRPLASVVIGGLFSSTLLTLLLLPVIYEWICSTNRTSEAAGFSFSATQHDSDGS